MNIMLPNIHFIIVTRGCPHVNWTLHIQGLRDSLGSLGYATSLAFVCPGADLVRGRNAAVEAANAQESGFAVYLDDDVFPSVQDVISSVDMISTGECDIVTADYVQRNPERGGVLKRGQEIGFPEVQFFSGFGFVVSSVATKWKHFADYREGMYLADDYSAFYNMQKRGLRVSILGNMVEHRPI